MGNRKNRFKFLFFWLVALIPLIFLIELTSYIVIQKCIPSRIRGRLAQIGIKSDLKQNNNIKIQQSGVVVTQTGNLNTSENSPAGFRMFHPDLGWDYPPGIKYTDLDHITYVHGELRERLTCTHFDSTLISSYGDSFTYCANVPNDQTWQTFLARKLGTNVLNFGVGGYGTDQAALKHDSHNTVKASITLLGILPENINRIVNIYRPFYMYNDSLRLTKPMFMKQASGIQLIPNPIQRASDIAKLHDLAFLEKLGDLDYWFQFDKKLPPLGFPWTFSLLNWSEPVLNQLMLHVPASLSGDTKRRYHWNLFEEPGPCEIMAHVVDLFVSNCRKRNSIPIVIFMPHKDYISELRSYGLNRIEPIKQFMVKREYLFIDAIEAMAELKPSRAELDGWYEGHATSEGNRILADILADYLLSHRRQVFQEKFSHDNEF